MRSRDFQHRTSGGGLIQLAVFATEISQKGEMPADSAAGTAPTREVASNQESLTEILAI